MVQGNPLPFSLCTCLMEQTRLLIHTACKDFRALFIGWHIDVSIPLTTSSLYFFCSLAHAYLTD